MHGHRVIAAIAAGALALPAAALAQSGGYPPPGGSGSGGGGDPAADVDAAGNPFTGGLAFEPPSVRVKVGEVVRWTNTDLLVPHTATEGSPERGGDEALWRESGDYGFPIEEDRSRPAPFQGSFNGFGPEATRKRAFEAGTHAYYCEVHPDQMRGVVRVPVTLREFQEAVSHGPQPRHPFSVLAIWSKRKPPQGQVFDLQRRRGGGRWRTVLHGTRRPRKEFSRVREGTVWRFRARLRAAEDPRNATRYSPPAKIKVG